jgi:hypothetical protein
VKVVQPSAERRALGYWAGWQDGRRFGWDERGPGWWRRLMWRLDDTVDRLSHPVVVSSDAVARAAAQLRKTIRGLR